MSPFCFDSYFFKYNLNLHLCSFFRGITIVIMSNSFNELVVSEKIRETEDSYSFLFGIPENLIDIYGYKAGQYLTIKLIINGEEIRRAYSIFTAPFEQKFGFTVKRVKDGKASNYLIEKVEVGQAIEVLPPEGRFTIEPEHSLQRDHYFIAGGSGITPVMSMILTVLEEEPMSNVYLFYANRNEDSIIFKQKLDAIEEQYEDQFHCVHVLSQPKKDKSKGLKGLLAKNKTSWKGWKGRIDASKLQRFLDDFPSKSGLNLYYLCGPGGLIDSSQTFLLNKEIDKSNILREYFTNPDQESHNPKGPVPHTGACEAEVKLNGETFTITIPEDKTVLEALIDLGKDPPYSCTSGACSTCVARVLEGEVKMDACFALDDDEVKEGLVLTCQSRPQTAKLKVDYQ